MKTQLKLSIAYLYPRSMNIYGDRGNIIALTQRCQWRNIQANVTEVEVDDTFDPSAYDLLFAGGGQDNHQIRIAQDLQLRKTALHEAIEGGVVCLLICGTYQMFGHYFKTADGNEIPGISVFDAYTVASAQRKIGNVVISLDLPVTPVTLVGFENHSGNTFIGNSLPQDSSNSVNKTNPLGKVIAGFGNNGEDGYEGAVYKNCFGTYLHGSLLPKNPHFADYLLQLALTHRYHEPIELPELDNKLELAAHTFVTKSRTKPID